MNITMVYDFTVRFLKDMVICGKKVLIKSIIIVNKLLKVKYMSIVKCLKKDRENEYKVGLIMRYIMEAGYFDYIIGSTLLIIKEKTKKIMYCFELHPKS